MIIYYLMIKTHIQTGLQYLCQTSKKNPHQYIGSGKYWKNHIKKHGKNIKTQIIQICYTKSALVSWGKYYSELWSVVKSNRWANLKEETGDGGPYTLWSDEQRKKLSESCKIAQNKIETKNKISNALSCHWLITAPDGKKFIIQSLRKFCNQNNIHFSNLLSVSKGKRSNCKGWKCEKYEV